MRKLAFIACGGLVGAWLRFAVKHHRLAGEGAFGVLNTLLPNLLGAFVLAFLLCEAGGILRWHADVRLGVTVGLLGAFTTFSALCKEITQLMQAGEFAAAAGYAALSVSAGLLAAWLGAKAADKTGGGKCKTSRQGA